MARALAAFYAWGLLRRNAALPARGAARLCWGGAEPDLTDKSAITKVRTRLGVAPLKQLFARDAPAHCAAGASRPVPQAAACKAPWLDRPRPKRSISSARGIGLPNR